MKSTFSQVLPCLYADNNGEISINYDAFEDNEEVQGMLEDKLYDLLNDGPSLITLELPAFTGVNIETQEEMSFEAQTFNLRLDSFKEEMDSCSEGKTEYTNIIDVTDLDTTEKFTIAASYFAAIDHSLIALDISAFEEEAKPNLFAVIEKVVEEGFMMHGVFDSLQGAVESYKDLKKTASLMSTDQKRVVIEEFPMNQALTYDSDNADTFLRNCINQYTIKGKIIKQ